ncbi:MAG TPA: FlgD immunoglobulin-like domain containing protein [bacterium]|nr:FlgD immunoglobulin-like domain containing protein [bacterium]
MLRASGFATAVFSAAISLVVPLGTARGQCINHTDRVHWVGFGATVGISTHANDVMVEGDLAYTADESSGLKVFDISDPRAPVLIGSLAGSSPAEDIAKAGNLAYLALQDAGLQIVDVSDPTTPFIVSTLDTPGIALGIAVSGSLAYVSDDDAGLHVVDVSDPALPAILGTVDTPGLAKAVAVSGNLAYVGDYTFGLQVIDVSSPASPAIVGTVDTPGGAVDVAVQGAYAYLPGLTGLLIVDISVPTAPAIAGTALTGLKVDGVAVAGNRAYLAGDQLQVVDVSNPSSPVLLGHLYYPGAVGVAVAGNHAVVASFIYGGIQIAEINSGTASVPISTSYRNAVSINDIVTMGDYAFLAEEYWYGPQGWVGVYDVSNPAVPQFVKSIGRGIASTIERIGDHLIVGGGASASTQAFQVIDVSNPASPVVVGGLDGVFPRDMAVSGNLAFVAGPSGLQIVDVSVPSAPAVIGTFPISPWQIDAVAVQGDCAYVGGSGTELTVVDVSDPTAPAEAAVLDLPGWAHGLCISGSHVFMAAWNDGLHVVDVSTPSLPTLEATVAVGFAGATRVAAGGGYAYVTVGQQGIALVDVLDPSAPKLVGLCDVASSNGLLWATRHVHLDGALVHVSSLSGSGIMPAQCEPPTAVGSTGFAAVARQRSVELSWSAPWSLRDRGFHVSRSEREESRYGNLTASPLRGRTDYRHVDPSVRPGVTYFYRLSSVGADGDEALLEQVRVTVPGLAPATLQLAGSNPFRGETAFRIHLPEDASVQLSVHDVRGRLVRGLLRDDLPAGEHAAVWDGRDARGRAAAGGVYFARLRAGDSRATRKVVLVPSP